MDLKIDFNSFWTLMGAEENFPGHKQAAMIEWEKHPEKQTAIIKWLQQHGAYKKRKPNFFIQDFKVQTPQRQPVNYRGRAIPAGLQVFSANYNNEWGMYTEQDIIAFNMLRPQN